jgi:RNA-directed DNA polymerase
MSIDKQILRNLIQNRVEKKKDILRADYELLSRLLQIVLFHNPISDVILQNNTSDWKWLPPDKSLFFSKPWTWLAIWNLTSQLFANIYLHPLDQFVKRTLHCQYYGRYVDDFILIHQNKEYLKNCILRIKEFLSNQLYFNHSIPKRSISSIIPKVWNFWVHV